MPSFSTLLSAVVAFSASAMALTTATTFNETSNPTYTPEEGDIIPVGSPYKITWGPTEKGTVSIVLLRGPSENAEYLSTIVEKLPNTGSYTWTPKADLEPDTLRYGLQLIIDANGQYQYSPQFGIKNDKYVSSSTSSAPTGYETGEPTTTSHTTVDVTTKSYLTSLVTVTTPPVKYNTTTTYPTYVAPTHNSTVTYVQPTPEPTESETTVPPVPSQTGAAASVKVASGLLLGVAGVAAMLL